jgi:two-component system, OmpR family, response regulator TctD
VRILLVEDHLPLAESVAQALRSAGLTVDVLHDGVAAEHALASEDYALAVLDVGLPRRDGFQVLAHLRERGKTLPVLMLTARGEVKDRVHGLNLGADDYLAKPFSTRELGARSAALLRRARADAEGAPGPDDAEVVQAGGGLVLLPVRHVAMFEGTPVPLTPPEVDVLAVLAREPGRTWERTDLVGEVWGGEFIESDYLIDVHVGNLRRKLRKAGAGTDRIRTVDGTAYVLVLV